jgi:hypothetical protein
MKTVRLLLIIASLVLLAPGPGNADEPSRQPSKPDTSENQKIIALSTGPRSAGQARDEKVSANGRPPAPNETGRQSDSKYKGRQGKPKIDAHNPKPNNNLPLAKSKAAGQASKSSGQSGLLNAGSKITPASGVPQPALNAAVPASKNGLITGKSVNRSVEPAKLPVGGGTTTPSARVARDRGNTTAAIGELAASSVKKSAAAVNGALIQRKP